MRCLSAGILGVSGLFFGLVAALAIYNGILTPLRADGFFESRQTLYYVFVILVSVIFFFLIFCTYAELKHSRPKPLFVAIGLISGIPIGFCLYYFLEFRGSILWEQAPDFMSEQRQDIVLVTLKHLAFVGVWFALPVARNLLTPKKIAA